jgi:hypothetical protein
MPVPGPRTQDRPLSGYSNPGGEQPDRINRWSRPAPAVQVGRTPNTMFMSLRGNILAPGTVRRMWRQVADMIPAQEPYSWTHNAPAPGRQVAIPRGFQITTALRYMARSVYIAGGTDATRFTALHTKIPQRVHSKPVTLNAGGVRNRPTVRNRLTSFGSRVPPLNNAKVPAANG